MTQRTVIVYFGNPELPAGMNADAFALDEFNGAGRSDVSPLISLSNDSLTVMVLQHLDFEIFECTDMTIPAENRTTVIQTENRTVFMATRCAA